MSNKLDDEEEITNIREYGGEDLGVRIVEHYKNGRWVIESRCQAGYDGTYVDLEDVIKWVKENKPELLQ